MHWPYFKASIISQQLIAGALGFSFILDPQTVAGVSYRDLVPFGNTDGFTSFMVGYRQLSSVLRHRVSGIMQPVTWPVCALMTLASILIATIFAFSVFANGMEWSTERFLQILKRVWVSLNSLLVDQSATDIKTQSLSRMVPWLLWSFLVLIVSQIYRGDLFSTLLHPEAPYVPRSLKALVATNMTVFSLDWFHKVLPNHHGSQGSFIVDLIHALKPTRNEEDKALLDSLLRNIHPSSSLGYAEFLSSYWNGIGIPGDNGAGSKVIPDQFAYMGKGEITKVIKYMLSQFTKSWISEEIPVLDYFERRTPVISRNYVNQMFRVGMAGFSESGLQSLWQNYGGWVGYHTQYVDVYRSLKKLEKTQLPSRDQLVATLNEHRRVEFAYLNCWTHKCRTHTDRIRDMFSRIPRQVFDVIFLYWGISVGAVVLVLVWETKKTWKKFLLHRVYLKIVSKYRSWGTPKEQNKTNIIIVRSKH